MPDDLREQVDALPKMWHLRRPASSNNDLEAYVPMDAVMAMFAERERQIRTKIEALQGLDWEGEQPYALGPWLHRNDVLNELNKA